MGDDDARAIELRQLGAKLAPQLGSGPHVERRERFVEEEQARLGHERAGQGHALLLPTGERARLGVAVPGEIHALEPFAGASPGLAARHPAAAQPERHVLQHREVREQEVVLEDDAH